MRQLPDHRDGVPRQRPRDLVVSDNGGAASDIPWQLVYEECLRYFYVLFPAMSKRIPLNDQPTVTAVAGEFLKRLSDPYRPTTLYMPLTHSMPLTKVARLRATSTRSSPRPRKLGSP